MSNNKVLDGLFGVCVGDALGVPVEFEGRDYLKKNPATRMIGGGTWDQPPGTWSDDSSLTFCLADSLCNGYDLNDIADKFCMWRYKGLWTAHGQAFDIGNTTARALSALHEGTSPLESGGKSQTENGNGSLMRILPIVFYVKGMEQKRKFDIVKEVSSITHAHSQSVISCQIYIEVLINILKGNDIKAAYENMKPVIEGFYQGQEVELEPFDRILDEDISRLQENKIRSGTYVIDTLEASLWCSINSNSYKETVLKAVNLGGDTDSTGAIAGGIAGLFYSYENIPEEWVEQIARKEDIMALAERLNEATKQ